MNLSELLTYLGYSALWRTVRLLPERTAYGLFEKLANRAYRRNGKRVKRLRSNYAHVSPGGDTDNLERMVQKGLSNAMRYWCDTFRISDWKLDRIANSVDLENPEIFYESVNSGRGVIVALPHAGNWDHAGLYFCSQGIQVNTVAEHLKPDRLFQRFLAHRAKMGMKVLDLESDVIGELERLLRSGALVALVSDRDLSKSGIEVEFFGARARMPAGPGLLAHRTGADLLVAYVGYRNEGIHIRFTGPVEVDRSLDEREEVARVTQALAKIFESDISQDPTSWHMQQRIFVDTKFNQSNGLDKGVVD